MYTAQFKNYFTYVINCNILIWDWSYDHMVRCTTTSKLCDNFMKQFIINCSNTCINVTQHSENNYNIKTKNTEFYSKL